MSMFIKNTVKGLTMATTTKYQSSNDCSASSDWTVCNGVLHFGADAANSAASAGAATGEENTKTAPNLPVEAHDKQDFCIWTSAAHISNTEYSYTEFDCSDNLFLEAVGDSTT